MTEKKRDLEKMQCRYGGCARNIEKDSDYCIFHMSFDEKERKGLWNKCMNKFYEILKNGEGNFKGFVLKNLNLSGMTVEQEIDFSCAEFFGECVFSSISGLDREESTNFLNKVNFYFATFNGETYFRWVTFNKNVDFSRANFNKNTFFEKAIFNGNAKFTNAQFFNKADFSKIKFNTANFSNVNFKDIVIFSPNEEDLRNGIPTFNKANFMHAYFEKSGSFDECIIKEGSFEYASIQNVSFRAVNLDNVRFAGAKMEWAYLADSEWTAPPSLFKMKPIIGLLSVSDPRYIIREEIDANQISKDKKEEKIKALKKAEATYRSIKHSLQNEGEYEKAGELYIHEMRMKRKRYWHTKGWRAKWNFFWNWFYAITCGYSERPKRVVINALILILIFSMVYYNFNAIGKEGDENYNPSLRECFYFSVVTFTTLGYGDYSPKLNFQLVAVTEAFFGAFTIALFVLVFGRKVMR